MKRFSIIPRYKRRDIELLSNMATSQGISSMKIYAFFSVAIILCVGIQAQSTRLRAALLSSGDWLNDVDGDNIPGQAQVDYPIHASVPKGTSFRCSDYEYAGYFGDIEAGCQAYHVCFPDGRNASFLCVNGTIFHQRYFVCDWWFHFDCGSAPSLYELNLFRKIPLPVLPPVQRRPFPGPIPQPKVDLPPPPPRTPQQRAPKKLDMNSIDNENPNGRNTNDRQNDRNGNDRQRNRNVNDKTDDREKKQKDTRKPISRNPNPENKYNNPFERGNMYGGGKEDECNCQCNAA
ncbi:chitin-binding type-2 domain-containing protein [Trichonephila clavata]|uniref:Chitin-binding type-2 domain-containing protein n=1 Tax=Trichonephila clavata TaxID=2740835 RepID=A0A8X6HWB7_TRICU|nr:chitin-binding type-2 domain-containing protein [Trichonephila clavata]